MHNFKFCLHGSSERKLDVQSMATIRLYATLCILFRVHSPIDRHDDHCGRECCLRQFDIRIPSADLLSVGNSEVSIDKSLT